ncbi:MAG: hypothetical protein WCP28_17220 [Actinomycetes bacterium]
MTIRAVAIEQGLSTDDASDLLDCLVEAGYLKTKQYHDPGSGTLTVFATTISGGALAGAAFTRPISRKKAEQLLDGLVARAALYNDTPDKPMVVAQVSVFGSYLDPQASELGDLDVQVTLEPRTAEATDPAWLLDYAADSGRNFSNIVECLAWAEREVFLLLRNRSSYISITTESLDRLTDRSQVVYSGRR